jgi:hypothetical protein
MVMRLMGRRAIPRCRRRGHENVVDDVKKHQNGYYLEAAHEIVVDAAPLHLGSLGD